MTHFRSVGLVLVVAGVSAPATALATYSIVAADRATRYVGGAVTSCVNGSVAAVYGSVPGLGAVAAQARINTNGRDQAVQLLLMNVAPAQIITQITAAGFDPLAAQRQYGVVDLMGRAAGHSGASNGVFANDIQGESGVFTYSVQGNILTGMAVLSQAEAAFRGEACDLPERLMRALEAGADNSQGDRRCTPGTPSSSAFIQVDRPDEPRGTYLRLSVLPDLQRSNPIPRLRAQFDAWRGTHPCADPGSPPPDAAVPGSDSGRDTGAAPPPDQPRPPDSGATPGEGRPPDAASGSAGAGANPGAGGSGGGGSGGASGPGPAPGTGGNVGGVAGSPVGESPEPVPAGCECRVGNRGGPGLLSLLVAAMLLSARRRRVARPPDSVPGSPEAGCRIPQRFLGSTEKRSRSSRGASIKEGAGGRGAPSGSSALQRRVTAAPRSSCARDSRRICRIGTPPAQVPLLLAVSMAQI